MKKYKAHVFICTNTREEGKESCGAKGSEKLRKKLKEDCKELFGKEVRINASGCLGPCEEGIACVIYPDNVWKLNLTTGDRDQLLEDIKKILS